MPPPASPTPPARPIRVLLVDDHAMVRRATRDFLTLHDDLEIVGEASDGAAAIERAALLLPDVVVMVSKILTKLGLCSGTQAALLAVRHGLDRSP